MSEYFKTPKTDPLLNKHTIELLEAKVSELTNLLEETRRYHIGHEVPLEWFVRRDKSIGNPGACKWAANETQS